MIAALARGGGIRPGLRRSTPDQIQPASLDLRLGEVAYRVRASFLPGPRTTVAERIDDLKLHEFALDRRRGAGDQLRLYRAAAGKPRAAGRRRRRRQSEKLDRPARRVHPRDRRPRPAASTASGRLSRPALCRDQPEDLSGAGARGLAAVADPLPPRPCAARRRGAARPARARAADRRRRRRPQRRHLGRRRSRRASGPTASSATAPSATPA